LAIGGMGMPTYGGGFVGWQSFADGVGLWDAWRQRVACRLG